MNNIELCKKHGNELVQGGEPFDPSKKKDKEQGPQFIFHIVNSVKGGSGKSTIALLLAAYYANEKLPIEEAPETKTDIDNVFIIDLDLHGSSWKKDYLNFNGRKSGERKVGDGFNFAGSSIKKFEFINDRLYKNNNGQSGYWPRLLVDLKFPPNRKLNIPVFLANPDDMISLTECELDLFENTIYQIISCIRQSRTGEKTFHIIFDMPPSYEAHAERIHNHLFLDVSSPLRKGFESNEYEIRHYLLSAVSPSHINLNIEYVAKMWKHINYSNSIDEYMGKGQYKLFLVLNDLTNITRLTGKMNFSEVYNSIKGPLTNALTELKKIRDNVSCKILLFPHVDREYMKLLYEVLSTPNGAGYALPIGQEEWTAINDMLNPNNENEKPTGE